MTHMAGEQDPHVQRAMIRIGSLCAIIGALVFMAANIVHPRSPNIQVTAFQVETVAHSDIWVTDHLLLLLGGLLLLPGLLAIQRSIPTGPGAAWAELGKSGAVVSMAIWAVLMAVTDSRPRSCMACGLRYPKRRRRLHCGLQRPWSRSTSGFSASISLCSSARPSCCTVWRSPRADAFHSGLDGPRSCWDWPRSSTASFRDTLDCRCW